MSSGLNVDERRFEQRRARACSGEHETKRATISLFAPLQFARSLRAFSARARTHVPPPYVAILAALLKPLNPRSIQPQSGVDSTLIRPDPRRWIAAESVLNAPCGKAGRGSNVRRVEAGRAERGAERARESERASEQAKGATIQKVNLFAHCSLGQTHRREEIQ